MKRSKHKKTERHTTSIMNVPWQTRQSWLSSFSVYTENQMAIGYILMHSIPPVFIVSEKIRMLSVGFMHTASKSFTLAMAAYN